MASTAVSIADICAAAKRASRELATLSSAVKDDALEAIAVALVEHADEILEANARDVELGHEAHLSDALLDRLSLTDGRIAEMAAGVRKIAALPDPVGEVIDGSTLPNGLQLRRVRVPLGVVAVVYEARPNVTIDAIPGTTFKGHVSQVGDLAIHGEEAYPADDGYSRVGPGGAEPASFGGPTTTLLEGERS